MPVANNSADLFRLVSAEKWDAALTATMAKHRSAIAEEAVASGLQRDYQSG